MGWYYANNDVQSARYYLGTRGKKHLLCLGMSPGVSTPASIDDSILNVEQMAFTNGFDSWIMMNVYPRRMEKQANGTGGGWDRDLHRENLKHIRDILAEIREKEEHPVIWAAWGSYIKEQDHYMACLEEIVALAKEYESRWITFTEVPDGEHPEHCLDSVPAGEQRPFDIDRYLARQ